MLARVARYEVEAERIDDAVRVFGEAATEIEGLAGFAGGSVLSVEKFEVAHKLGSGS
jgi:hypothetical protein